MPKSYISDSESDYNLICQDILNNKKYTVFFMLGELGAGKTTMVKHFLSILGSEDSASSPTFSIMNEYLIGDTEVYHFDLYRLKTLDEVLDIGIEDYLYSGRLCFIEWPDILIDLELTDVHKIEIEHLENSHRRINFN
jgi:tRNA threonylcarbamoyladenosine biosynthesis protein TsaE